MVILPPCIATLYWPFDLVSESLFDLPTISSVNDGLEGIF